jgi:ATP-dependent Clp endopeptidase proteolytic subunit ClpP
MSAKKSWFSIVAKSETEAEVSIYDVIGLWGVTAKQFADALKPHAGKNLTVRINSPGGAITEGTAIFNALKRHKGKVTTAIDGLAASMGSYVALAGSPVKMAENAYYMIHNPSGYAGGESKDLRKYADVLDRMKSTLVAAYVAKSGLEESEVETMMDEETWLTAKQAKAKGFIDEITEPLEAAALARIDADALKSVDLQNFRKTPAAFGGSVDTPEEDKMTVEQLQARVTELEGQLTEAQGKHTAAAAQAQTNHAKVTDLTAQIGTLTTERDTALNEVKQLKETAKTAEARALEIVAGLGVQPVDKDKEGEKGEALTGAEAILAKYEAIEDADERTAFFAKNKTAIYDGQRRRQIKK